MAVTAQPPPGFPETPAGGPLGIRNFQLLLVTQLATGLRMPMIFLTQAWYVTVVAPEGQRVLLLGLLASLRGGAFLAYILFGGALADRYPRRTMVIVAHALGFAGTVATGALLFLPGASEGRGLWLPGMFLAFTAFGLINAQDLPTRNAIIRDVVPDAMVARAVTLFQLGFAATMLMAGPIAGFAIDHLGFGVTYLIASLGHVAVLAAVWPMRLSETAADPEAGGESMLANVRAGIQHLRSDAIVRWVVFATWLGFAAGISVMGLLIAAWASDVLRLDATGWGLMMMTWGGGGVLSLALLAWRHDLDRRGALFLGAMLLFGLSVIAFGLSRNVALAFLFNGTAGATFMVVRVLGIAIVQGTVPNRLLGRVLGLLLLAQGIAEVGGLAVGALGQAIGLQPLYLLAGASIVLLALAVVSTQRPLRSVR